jgi:hypothetical protein
LWFLDDDDRVKMMIGLTEFALKVATLGTLPMKRWPSRCEELEEAREQSQRSLPKNFIRPFPVQNR